MNFYRFLEIYNDKPFIESSTYSLYTGRPDILRVQVSKWKEKGYLNELRKGLYIFSPKYLRKPVSKMFIANYLVSPSYISMEYALGFYSLIPEKVNTITSITTKKTNRFKNDIGLFTYNSIKEELFVGYEFINIEDEKIFMAKPEKAIMDYIYINKRKIKPINKKKALEFYESIRLQNVYDIKIPTIRSYFKYYPEKMKIIYDSLIEYVMIYKDSYKKM